MGIFDKIKKFATGASTANVVITSINGGEPDKATVAISDTSVRGHMRVTAQQDCTMLAMKYDVMLKTQSDDGHWSSISTGTSKILERRDMKTGDVFEHDWILNGIDIETYLRNQSFTDFEAVRSNPKVKLIVRCTADVEGSPFDPDAEVEVNIGRNAAGPCKIETTVVEGNPASIASFPVTDSVCKGTVVVTAKSGCVLTATRYELWLEMNTPTGPVETLCAKDQHPEIKAEGLAGMSVSFGGTNITFPHAMTQGEKATQTWSIRSIDLTGVLAANGFANPRDAVDNPAVKFIVRTFADVENGGVSSGRTEVKLV